METLRGATLHIGLGMFSTYHVIYTARYEGDRVAIIPSIMHGQAQLKAFLQHLAMPANAIEVTMAMVESQLSYTLDLSHLDKDQVTRLLQRYGHTDCSA